MVGALLLVMGLSLSGPEQIDTPIAEAEGDADGSAAEMLAAAPAPEVIEDDAARTSLARLYRGDGDNLSLIFNRAGFTDTDLYRVARDNDDRSLDGSTPERPSVSNRIPTVIYSRFDTSSLRF